MPSGRRSSEPTPCPNANGTAPNKRRHRGHHDRTETQQAGLIYRVVRRFAFLPLGIEREVDHHDGVLLHDADQQYDADDAPPPSSSEWKIIKAKIAPTPAEGSVDKNRDRMDVALVENAQNDVHRHQRRQNQNRLVGQRSYERLRQCPGKPPASRAVRASLFLPSESASTASPSAAFGARLKETVVAGNCPMWLIRIGVECSPEYA